MSFFSMPNVAVVCGALVIFTNYDSLLEVLGGKPF